jgi:SAM-dependent methyltransferase
VQQIDCPLCDSPEAIPVAQVRDRLLGIEGQFHMVRCACCGLHYLNPQPAMADLVPYYPEDYDPYATPMPDQLSLLQRFSLNYGLRKRSQAVEDYKRGGQLLEIGCAGGLFLDAMQRRGGWQVQGVEISEVAAGYARSQFGLDVFQGALEDAQFLDGSFDAVVMWDVLEHVHRPQETLLEIRRLLKPDGVLVFRLPLLDSWDRKLFGPYWSGWDAPRHLTLFSRRTIGLMLARTGFRVQRMTCISGGYPTFALSLRFWARDHLSEPARKRLQRTLEALPVRLAVAPYFYLVDRLGKSTVVTVVARPDDRKHPDELAEVFES